MKNYLHPAFFVSRSTGERRVIRIASQGVALALLLVGTPAASSPVADQTAARPPPLRAEDLRVAAVVHRIATKGAPFCTPSHPVTGMVLHQLGQYYARDQSSAEAQFGLSRGPGIVVVVPESPAARIGLAPGDVLVVANGSPFASAVEIAAERDSKKRRRRMEEVEAHLERMLLAGPVRLEIMRRGKMFTVILQPKMGCEARGRLARSSQANAFADGRYAIMTTRMLNFVRNDDELAIVMAHEIAHNLLRHPDQLRAQKKGFFGGIARERAFEEDADRLSVKLLWSAGFDLSAIMPFWRRLHATFIMVPTPKFLNAHPSLARREQIVMETLKELQVGAGGLSPSRPLTHP